MHEPQTVVGANERRISGSIWRARPMSNELIHCFGICFSFAKIQFSSNFFHTFLSSQPIGHTQSLDRLSGEYEHASRATFQSPKGKNGARFQFCSVLDLRPNLRPNYSINLH